MILSRYIKRNLLLLITLVGIITFLSCGISYFVTFSKENEENSYYFNDSTYSLLFSEEDVAGKDFCGELIDAIAKDGSVNLVNDKMQCYFGRTHGIYLNSNLEVTRKIKEGRFFNADDFKDNDKKLAVVGDFLIDNIKVVNNKKMINIYGYDYEVIGIMGDKNLSKEANLEIIFNLNSLINVKNTEIKSSGWFISSKGDLSDSIDALKNTLKEYEFVSSEAQRISNPVLSVFNNHSKRIYYSSTIFASIFVNIFIVIFFWFDGIVKEIGVRKSFGADNKRIYLHVFKLFLINNVVATVVSTIILLLLEKFKLIGAEYYFYTINLVFIFLFILLFSILLLSILVKKINNIKPNYILRGIK